MDITVRDVVIMGVSLALALLLVSGCSGKKVLHSTPPGSASTGAAGAEKTAAPVQAGKPAPSAEIPSAEAVSETPLATESAPAPAGGAISVPAAGQDAYEEEGLASWYGSKFHGKHTASGEVFDAGRFTAAHRVLPFGSMVEVTNLDNGKRAVVRINDRGPFKDVEHRIIDLSRASAESLGMGGKGLIKVRIRRLDSSAQAGVLQRVDAAEALESSAPNLPGAVRIEPEQGAPVVTVREEVVVADTEEEWISAESGKVESVHATTAIVAEEVRTSADAASGKNYVQVGAFTDADNAGRVLKDLHAKGYPGSRIVSVNRDGKKFMRVQAGPFAGHGEIERALTRLKATYPDSRPATD